MPLLQVGTISDYTVIEAVGRTLASLLMTEMEDPVSITVASPGEDYGAPVGGDGLYLGSSRVNLFLYNVREAPHSMNMDWVDVGEGKQIPYPLTLQLYYMLNIFTPDKSSNLDEHRILGDVMRVFHANAIVDPIFFEGTLNPNAPPAGTPWEELRVVHHPLPLDDLAAIWHAINKPYKLSVAYETSVAMIKPPEYKSRRTRRVDVTHVKAFPFRGKPVIRHIEPVSGYAGDTITVKGENFLSDFLKVFFDGSLVTPDSVSATEITLTISEGLPPGLYWLEVSSEEGGSAKARFEEISPFIYRLDPELKYTEDADFPKTEGGEPLLSIWGGNFVTGPPGTLELLASPEGGVETIIPVSNDNFTTNRVDWVVPPAMREGSTSLRIRQNGARTSNSIILEIPAPLIYRADPDPTSVLPQELIIMGDFFRQGAGNTELYIHPGPLADLADLVPANLVPVTVISETEIRTTIPAGTANGNYQLVVRVYGNYYSVPFEIRIAT